MMAWGDSPRTPQWRTEPWLALLTLLTLVALAGVLMELRDSQDALARAEWRVGILEEHSYAGCHRLRVHSWDPPGREVIHLSCPKEATP